MLILRVWIRQVSEWRIFYVRATKWGKIYTKI